jgi:putative transposase
MISTTYRIYPKRAEQEKLDFSLDMCRITYNHLLEQYNKGVFGRTQLAHTLLELKEKDKRMLNVYSKALQPQCDKLIHNLRALKAMKAKGREVGDLRFKGRGWFKSFNYNQSGFTLTSKGKKGVLTLSKIGAIPIKVHRPIEGTIKQVTLKKSCNKWYAIIVTDANPKRTCGEGEIGIDLGLKNYIMTSEAERIEHPHIFKKYQLGLKKAQQSLARKKKGSSNRAQARLRVEKHHAKIANARNDWLHKTSSNLVKRNRFISITKDNILSLIKLQSNALNIIDAGWGKLAQLTFYKAANAGGKLVQPDSHDSTRECSRCGTKRDMTLDERIYRCINPKCGLVIDRDLNSGKIALNRGKELARMEKVSDVQGTQLSMKYEAPSGRAE